MAIASETSPRGIGLRDGQVSLINLSRALRAIMESIWRDGLRTV
jgi:hypothetical protein